MGVITISRCWAVCICFFTLLLCPALVRGSEASFISFQVPGASGTYPMSVNNAMVVTGYYYASSTVVRGFIRAADGTFSTFDIYSSLYTEPEGINDAGDVTGYYLAADEGDPPPQSFIRYADGHIVTFNACQDDSCNASVSFSINKLAEVAGAYPHAPINGVPFAANSAAGYIRAANGSFTALVGRNGAYQEGLIPTSINGRGTVTGFYQSLEGPYLESFKEDTRGELTQGIFVPAPGSNGPYTAEEFTLAQGINAEGTIVGWYGGCNFPCNGTASFRVGAFLLSAQNEMELFTPPGKLVTSPQAGIGGLDFYLTFPTISAPHLLSINQSGSVIGSYTDAAGAQHGFVRNPYGTVTPFDPPRGHQTTATSINDSDVITGTYLYDGTNPTAVGFLRIPQPEP